MSNVLIFDKATGKAVVYLESVNTPEYLGRDDVIINPDKALIDKGIPYLKVSAGVVSEVSAEEKVAVDAILNKEPIENPLTVLQDTVTAMQQTVDDCVKRIEALEKAKG